MPKREPCPQCEAVMINGLFCHETGCPERAREIREAKAAEWADEEALHG